MVSIPRLSMGHVGGGTPLGDSMATEQSSPVSPKSWEDSLLELDSDLQKICGSPSPASSTLSLFKCGTATPLSLSTQTGDVSSPPAVTSQEAAVAAEGPRLRSASLRQVRCGVRESPAIKRPLSQPQEQSPPTHHYLLRSQSCLTSGSTRTTRPVPVRHEETSVKLAQKLSRICGPEHLHESLNMHVKRSHRAHDVMALYHHVFRRESLKAGFKHQVSVSGVNLSDLTVCASEDGEHLLVTSQTPPSHVIEQVALPSGISLRHVMCYLLEEKLYLRERSKPLWRCDSEHAGPHYLPIIAQAEHTHDLQVTIRIPDAIRYEDLSVRTVDDCLIISRKRSSLPAVSLPQYEVTLVLPDMGDSRGVQASLSHNNLLYITVSFDSRRYTQ